jgi:nickel-dependent lactate racemase
MMLQTQLIAPPGQYLSKDAIINALTCVLEKQFNGQRVLVLIPDHTRSLPLPFLFRVLVNILNDTSKLDFMVALGTHPPLSEENLNKLVGVSAEEREACYSHIGLLNHTWNDPTSLVSIGAFEQDQIKAIAGDNWHPSLPTHIDICLNKTALEYDQILILGPTFPHEVVGFSGGTKYVFPGISGPDMINATHWLGALSGVVGTIGFKDTHVRAMIDAAAAKLTIPLTLIALVVEDHNLSGLFIGDKLSTWSAAADLSAQRHIRWFDEPFQRVLSCAPAMYDELWTCAKAMYKLEPATAMGGEVIIYAPHLETISHVHGKYIQEIGYHILPYFLSDWEHFKHVPLGVLAHSTHLRGSGVMENGIEKPNVKVTLASRIPAEECAGLNLGYLDPASIDIEEWQGHESEGILYVPKAGEILYRCK